MPQNKNTAPSSGSGSGSASSQSQSNNSSSQSTYSMVKEGWGGMNNFMASHGIKPTADGYAEANSLAKAYKNAR
ncbi:hypothetical protein CFIMG_004211RA [Ceratocystis fimbriata CBS 114723]|uniref:Uncharacterized protein n=1 Tax=Ceratocystis fimbriata CBS 114723 TaxID=1035309 RepID=A0A2C5WZD9_9PEZI|nr:hypothetical protein CFIMG_004211RA [Ceratocystis fimbriata CBS 114723]